MRKHVILGGYEHFRVMGGFVWRNWDMPNEMNNFYFGLNWKYNLYEQCLSLTSLRKHIFLRSNGLYNGVHNYLNNKGIGLVITQKQYNRSTVEGCKSVYTYMYSIDAFFRRTVRIRVCRIFCGRFEIQ